MKGIRRSLNKDRIGAPTPTYSSLPTAGYPAVSPLQQHPQAQQAPRPSLSVRPTGAPAPPKRVIRAIQAYQASSSQELSFAVGDFFHVVSDEGGDDWFDAANPMTGARGMVPASHFQVLGRNVRETAQGAAAPRKGGASSTSPSAGASSSALELQQDQQQQGRDGGYGQKGYIPAGGPMQSTFVSSPQPSPSISAPAASNGSSRTAGRPPSQPAPKSQPLYGIVQYDFVAERADELDAKRGEPIIVIAQSNHEWFVAKPIGRLGGPGLIPVAFVEIQDMTTGKPVENVEELIRSAVVPKVEEWKKMTADYKSASIPLGRFDFTAGNAPAKSSVGPSSNGARSSNSPAQGAARHPSQGSSPALEDSGAGSNRSSDPYDRDPNAPYSWARERERYGLVTSASVESFHQEEGSFWFHLRAFFSTGASLVLYRLYQDFYDFQIGLMDEYPVEAGRVPPGGEGSTRPLERILPMMPGPTDFEDEVVCAQRVHDLSIYLGDLCALPDRIRGSGLMYEFFVPRAGDVEVTMGNGKGDTAAGQGRVSIEGQYGELVEYLDAMDGSDGRAAAGGSRDTLPDVGRLSLNGQDEYSSYQEPQSSSGRQSSASKGSSGAAYSEQRASNSGDSPYQTQQPSYQQAYPSPQLSSGAPSSLPLGTANANVPFVKIKIFHRNTDDLIAIRVPPSVSYATLLEKVRERLGSDVVNLRYREEVGSASGPAGGGQVVMAGGARLIGIESDSDLERWVRSGARLVLYAD